MFSPWGLQHHLIRMEGGRPVARLYYSQQSCANLLVSVLGLRKVFNENSKESQEERSCSAVACWFLPQPLLQFTVKLANSHSCFEISADLTLLVMWKIRKHLSPLFSYNLHLPAFLQMFLSGLGCSDLHELILSWTGGSTFCHFPSLPWYWVLNQWETAWAVLVE